MGDRFLVVGLGVTGLAVARALLDHGAEVVATDDHLDAAPFGLDGLDVAFHPKPDAAHLDALVAEASAVVPAPGLPDAHAVFALAAIHGVQIVSEFDLAAAWDERPIVAITGTDGKTTVTTLVVAMLEASGLAAVGVGNTDIPLVEALADPLHDVFVVEASSFRLGRSRHFAPRVAAWLNFAPDHLDVHASLDDYESAKAAIWRDQTPDQVAIGNADDPVVRRHLDTAPARRVTFGSAGDYRVHDGWLVAPRGRIIEVASLPRRFPHDLANALAASACALEMGGSLDAVADVLRGFVGLPHRLEFVAEHRGVAWYDDSKATVPHASVAAASAFEQVVLIAGGRNKGLDLADLTGAGSVTAVVAIGEAADEVLEAFGDRVPSDRAPSMAEAVRLAADRARPGQTVLLSPGCASFDWYRSYGERGDDFKRCVGAYLETQGRP